MAESSPYMEAMKRKGAEVLFCFEPYDELVLMNLGQFDKKNFKSIENEMVEDKDNEKVDSTGIYYKRICDMELIISIKD